ncbi:MAG: hypothetical protein IPP85_09990 [Propionivibrio sp.]|nr:hypothetical protein [Propionivibrio sp.]
MCHLCEGTLAREIYGKDEIVERHRHRYEINNNLLGALEDKGLIVSGRAPVTHLCEMVELLSDASVVRRLSVPPGIHLSSRVPGNLQPTPGVCLGNRQQGPC